MNLYSIGGQKAVENTLLRWIQSVWTQTTATVVIQQSICQWQTLFFNDLQPKMISNLNPYLCNTEKWILNLIVREKAPIAEHLRHAKPREQCNKSL